MERHPTTNPELTDFCRRQHPWLVHTLGQHVDDPGVADQLARDTLVRAVQHWPELRLMTQPSPEFWTEATALMMARRKWRRRRAAARARRALPVGPGTARSVRTSPLDHVTLQRRGARRRRWVTAIRRGGVMGLAAAAILGASLTGPPPDRSSVVAPASPTPIAEPADLDVGSNAPDQELTDES